MRVMEKNKDLLNMNLNMQTSKTEQTIPIESIIIQDRTCKDLGDINLLAESISSVGLLQPIVINKKNELIDGERRIKAYIHLKRKQILFYQVSLKQVLLGELQSNSNRKDFTSSERVAISNAVEKYLREYSRGVGRPRINQEANKNIEDNLSFPASSINATNTTKNNVVKLTTLSGRIKDNVSRYFGISHNTLEKEKEIINAAEQNPEAFEKIRKKLDQKKISVGKAFHEIQKQVKKAQILALASNTTTNNTSPNNITLLYGDFRQLSKTIPNESIDLIFTDPPYSSEYVPLYDELAIIAHNILREGGSIVTYVRHNTIPKVIEIMEKASLTYWWPIAVILSGSFAKNYPKQDTIKWKEWEQSIIEAEHIISRLTVTGQTVFDPMMGSGTTGAAAVQNDRKFIGIEIGSEKFELAKARIGEAIRTAS